MREGNYLTKKREENMLIKYHVLGEIMLIAIEGIDGSGKGTQSRLITDRLVSQGYTASLLSFPCYEETFFGHEVGKYLNGEYGGLTDVPVQFAAMLYAGDRFEKKQNILSELDAGHIIVCDRYVPSNLAHQAAKVNKEKQQEVVEWISKLEYNIYGLPKPDVVFYLDLPVKNSVEMVMRKNVRSYTSEKLDLHEAATEYLDEVSCLFKILAKNNFWRIIDCLHSNGDIRSIEDISDQLFHEIMSLLVEKS